MATAWRRRCPTPTRRGSGGRRPAQGRGSSSPRACSSRSRASSIRSTHRGTDLRLPGLGCAARTDRSPWRRSISSPRSSPVDARVGTRSARARRVGGGMGRRRGAARRRRRLQRARPRPAADDGCLRRITARDLAAACREPDGTAAAARRDLRVAQSPRAGGGNRGCVARERPPAGDRARRSGTRADRTLGRSWRTIAADAHARALADHACIGGGTFPSCRRSRGRAVAPSRMS